MPTAATVLSRNDTQPILVVSTRAGAVNTTVCGGHAKHGFAELALSLVDAAKSCHAAGSNAVPAVCAPACKHRSSWAECCRGQLAVSEGHTTGYQDSSNWQNEQKAAHDLVPHVQHAKKCDWLVDGS